MGIHVELSASFLSWQTSFVQADSLAACPSQVRFSLKLSFRRVAELVCYWKNLKNSFIESKPWPGKPDPYPSGVLSSLVAFLGCCWMEKCCCYHKCSRVYRKGFVKDWAAWFQSPPSLTQTKTNSATGETVSFCHSWST